jgi:hypothetical protein
VLTVPSRFFSSIAPYFGYFFELPFPLRLARPDLCQSTSALASPAIQICPIAFFSPQVSGDNLIFQVTLMSGSISKSPTVLR